MVLIEAAVGRVEDALTAQEAGVDRIELSCGLEVGGLTPSGGMLRELTGLRVPLVALVRPRAGGFVYSRWELLTMYRDIDMLSEWGAAGIAVGALQAGGINESFVRETVRRAAGCEVVFHRAFDLVASEETLDRLIDLGVKRVLTSGGAVSALAGAERLRKLIAHAAGRIEMLPAGGIGAENVAELVRRTGCLQVHGSFSEERVDEAGGVGDARFRVTSGERIAAVRKALRRM